MDHNFGRELDGDARAVAGIQREGGYPGQDELAKRIADSGPEDLNEQVMAKVEQTITTFHPKVGNFEGLRRKAEQTAPDYQELRESFRRIAEEARG